MSAIRELKLIREFAGYQDSETLLNIAVMFGRSSAELKLQGFHKEAATRATIADIALTRGLALAGAEPDWELGEQI